MRVSTEIKTGDGRVMEYLLSPVMQAVKDAGIETMMRLLLLFVHLLFKRGRTAQAIAPLNHPHNALEKPERYTFTRVKGLIA